MTDYDDERDLKDVKKIFYEWDCPLCSANNPYGDGFREKEEIRCCYCGANFMVAVSDSGKLKLKEI